MRQTPLRSENRKTFFRRDRFKNRKRRFKGRAKKKNAPSFAKRPEHAADAEDKEGRRLPFAFPRPVAVGDRERNRRPLRLITAFNFPPPRSALFLLTLFIYPTKTNLFLSTPLNSLKLLVYST